MPHGLPLFGVVGSPIAHSRSPLLHRAAYAAIGFEASYERTEVAEGGLADFLTASGDALRGLSVTMPLKREAWSIAVERDRAAELTGVVNTLHRPPGADVTFHGANTDVGGIVDAVGAAALTPGHVLVLGAGATASSAIVAAAELGATTVTLAVRSPERAGAAAGLARAVGLDARVVPLDGIDRVTADVVVSTLPGGTPLTVLPLSARDAGAVLLDAAYAPFPSTLVASWFAIDAPVVHGLAMLVHQAARQVRLFTGLDDAAWSAARNRVAAAMFGAVGLDPTGIARPDPARR